MEKCLLDNVLVEIPQVLCEEETLFNAILSIDTWNNVLTESHKLRLMAFLPTFSENDKEEKIESLQRLFSGQNFRFGNPVHQFFEKLRDGMFVPDISRTAALIRKTSYREYKVQQRKYHCNLLQDILISRKRLLEAALEWGPWQGAGGPGSRRVAQLQGPRASQGQAPQMPLRVPVAQRARWRYFTELQDLRDRLGDPATSDEDDNYPEGGHPRLLKKYRKQLQNFEASLSPDMCRVTSTLSSAHGRCDTNCGRFLSKCLTLSEITEERFRDMLALHRQKRLIGVEDEELDTSSITLEDVIARTNLSRKPTVPRPEGGRSKKTKWQPQAQQQPQQQVPASTVAAPAAVATTAAVTRAGEASCATVMPTVTPPVAAVKAETPPNVLATLAIAESDEDDMDVGGEQQTPQSPTTPVCSEEILPSTPLSTMLGGTQSNVSSNGGGSSNGGPVCFFSLLRDLFNETAEQKMSATKLEERVRAWSSSPVAVSCLWSMQRDNWGDLVSSALKFLAGDSIGILPDNFVPYLDYKEKQQQWQWIGAGRDSDTQVLALCQHWLQHREDVAMDALEATQGSPPPPKSITDWTVRPTTDEERLRYRDQECVRYQNPHKAFTFRVHGYEAVVGPVKGVYGKESGVNKAREHSLLVSDRPPFVTILSLVRDAAARLPNGEGTRADICELLKDSQYLALASDQQIHTVVSGALDRLHYEKDPCVKYDVNRKLWIYLHRNRTEEEFEKIHQAQAAAAKAKKAIQKNKAPRLVSEQGKKQKTKDSPRTPPTTSASTLLSPSAILPTSVTAANSTAVTTMSAMVPSLVVTTAAETAAPVSHPEAAPTRTSNGGTPVKRLAPPTLPIPRAKEEPASPKPTAPPMAPLPSVTIATMVAPAQQQAASIEVEHLARQPVPQPQRHTAAIAAAAAKTAGFQTIVIKQEAKSKPVMARLVSGSQVVCNLVGAPRPTLRIGATAAGGFLPAPRLTAVGGTTTAAAAAVAVTSAGPKVSPCIPTTSLASGVILTSPSQQPTVVLANQGTLKSSPAYVMATTAGGAMPTVVMATQPLKGIKVIPVPSHRRATRPLLARLIGPALRPPFTAPQSTRVPGPPGPAQGTPLGAQPVIVQVQTGDVAAAAAASAILGTGTLQRDS